MFKRRVFSIVAAAAVLMSAGCFTAKKDASFRGIGLTPSFQSSVTVADLEVAEKKVMGQATGRIGVGGVTKTWLEMDAVAAAIQAAEQSGVGADVLVGAHFFYETIKNDEMIVIVVGYPARYRNFRPQNRPHSSDDAFTVQAVGGAVIIGYEESAVTVEHVDGNVVITTGAERPENRGRAPTAQPAGDPQITGHAEPAPAPAVIGGSTAASDERHGEYRHDPFTAQPLDNAPVIGYEEPAAAHEETYDGLITNDNEKGE